MYNQKGFTLIEFIVVIAIIVVVAGILIPVYFSMKPTIRINGAARQIQGDLMWAKMRAVSENNDYIIVFGEAGPDLSNNTYYIYDDDENDFDPENIDANELVKTIVIPNDYDAVGFGFISGINETNNSTALSGNPVKFGSTGTPSKPIWFKFEPNGRSNIPGGIYIILDEDKTSGRKDRSRAITVIQTGRVRVYNYNAGDDQWD